MIPETPVVQAVGVVAQGVVRDAKFLRAAVEAGFQLVGRQVGLVWQVGDLMGESCNLVVRKSH